MKYHLLNFFLSCLCLYILFIRLSSTPKLRSFSPVLFWGDFQSFQILSLDILDYEFPTFNLPASLLSNDKTIAIVWILKEITTWTCYLEIWRWSQLSVSVASKLIVQNSHFVMLSLVIGGVNGLSWRFCSMWYLRQLTSTLDSYSYWVRTQLEMSIQCVVTSAWLLYALVVSQFSCWSSRIRKQKLPVFLRSAIERLESHFCNILFQRKC